MKRILISICCFFLISPCYTQTKSTNLPFNFDKISGNLKKTKTPESEKIKQWIRKSIRIKPGNYDVDYSTTLTKECQVFLSDIPDDIMLMNEEVPGTMEKEFIKKWSRNFDMKRIPPVNPFSTGNGGCIQVYILNLEFIGSNSGEYYYKIRVSCDTDKRYGQNLIIRVINNNGKYLIDNIMDEEKQDYFKMFQQ